MNNFTSVKAFLRVVYLSLIKNQILFNYKNKHLFMLSALRTLLLVVFTDKRTTTMMKYLCTQSSISDYLEIKEKKKKTVQQQ